MSISASFAEILRTELAGVIELTEDQLSQLSQHYERMLRWNDRLNLTRVTDLHEAAVRHYCESLFLAAHITGTDVVDVGSGAGFPGIPIAVAHPEWSVTLVEAHKRKAVFLREATRNFPNVAVADRRAEELDHMYDWLVSRAVQPSAVLRLRIAQRFAILIGADDARSLPDAACIPLPWGKSRVLAIGDLG